jgi:hypothetical protein
MNKNYKSIIKEIDRIHKKRKELNKLEEFLVESLKT